MTKIYLLFSAICFILLVYLFSVNTANVNKLNELEGKIKRLQEVRIDKPLPTKAVDQVQRKEPEQIKKEQVKHDQVEQITLDSLSAVLAQAGLSAAQAGNPQMKQMIDEAVKQHLQKEAESKRAQGIYSSVNFLAKMLNLHEEQMDKFWQIMSEFYAEYDQISEGFKGTDKASREAYRYQLQQLQERLKQQLKSILTPQQMEGLEIRLGIQ